MANRLLLAALGILTGFGSALAAEPPYSDTAGTVFDIIRVDDPSTFQCLEPQGRAARQIWDKRVDGEPIVDAYIYNAHFTDGTRIEIAINPEFGPDALAEANRYTHALGQLPTSLRAGIQRFSVHDGDESFHAGTGQIVLYSGRVDQRLTYDHLEESILHESVHASWDEALRLSAAWQAAQAADGGFLTDYAARSPDREDLAETTLFAFAILHHPDRFPPVDTEDTLKAAGHRIDFIQTLLPKDQPLTYQVGPAAGCLTQ